MSSRGIKFPVYDDTISGFFFQSDKTTKEQITSQILLLLHTMPNERFYLPSYGTNLWTFIFEQNDSFTRTDIESYIKRKVGEYIPNVTIQEIDYETDSDDETRINIFITFTFDDDRSGDAVKIMISNKEIEDGE